MRSIVTILAKLSIALATLMSLSTFTISPAVFASAKTEVQNGVNAIDSGASQGNAEDNVNNTIANVVNVLAVITGVLAVIMIIFGGFRYITSGGASDKVTGAKNTILYALIGLVIVALAKLIVKFVLIKATG